MHEQPDVVLLLTSAFALGTIGYCSMTLAASHPSQPNRTTHRVPRLPEISDWLSVFACEDSIPRPFACNTHGDDRSNFLRHLNDTGVFVLRRTGIQIKSR